MLLRGGKELPQRTPRSAERNDHDDQRYNRPNRRCGDESTYRFGAGTARVHLRSLPCIRAVQTRLAIIPLRSSASPAVNSCSCAAERNYRRGRRGARRGMTMTINDITGQIVDAAMKAHTVLRPGLLASTYEACLAFELSKRGLR